MSRLLQLLLVVVPADDIEAVRIVAGARQLDKVKDAAPAFRYLAPTALHRDAVSAVQPTAAADPSASHAQFYWTQNETALEINCYDGQWFHHTGQIGRDMRRQRYRTISYETDTLSWSQTCHKPASLLLAS